MIIRIDTRWIVAGLADTKSRGVVEFFICRSGVAVKNTLVYAAGGRVLKITADQGNVWQLFCCGDGCRIIHHMPGMAIVTLNILRVFIVSEFFSMAVSADIGSIGTLAASINPQEVPFGT